MLVRCGAQRRKFENPKISILNLNELRLKEKRRNGRSLKNLFPSWNGKFQLRNFQLGKVSRYHIEKLSKTRLVSIFDASASQQQAVQNCSTPHVESRGRLIAIRAVPMATRGRSLIVIHALIILKIVERRSIRPQK